MPEKVDKSDHEAVLKNVVLSGGSTSLNGFSDRIVSDIHREKYYVDVNSAESVSKRMFATWIGGSHLPFAMVS
jgi:actin-related protein